MTRIGERFHNFTSTPTRLSTNGMKLVRAHLASGGLSEVGRVSFGAVGPAVVLREEKKSCNHRRTDRITDDTVLESILRPSSIGGRRHITVFDIQSYGYGHNSQRKIIAACRIG